MTTRYFTVEEANALLPRLEPLMKRLLERRARAARMSRELEHLLQDVRIDFGGRLPSALALDFMEIERLIRQIQSLGCLVKDINVGLVDFLAERNGRDVYLCWRYGEPEVGYFHELHTGYNGRQRV
ncbi:MAG: DUF2203 family protein [Chloroflexi bacterium]|nr:MAG: DUF2203 family protein [Chloroflexota bacterium]